MKKVWYVAGNILHVAFIFVMLGFVLRAALQTSGQQCASIAEIWACITINDIYTFIGAVAFVLFGIVGIYEFAYLNDIRFLVLPMYARAKENNLLKQAERMMQIYYKRDVDFITQYEKERTEYLLQAMGIEERQFRYINYEIVKARVKPDRNIYSLKCKAKKILFQKEFIIDQSGLEVSEIVYDKVDYFLNMYTALYDSELCRNVARIMSQFLVLSLGENIERVDYIVVPQGGNFLLGLEVARQFHKKFIFFNGEERIQKKVFWDGTYDAGKRNNIIVLHDVLVSGKRIYESIEKLPADTYDLMGIYSLFRYMNENFRPIDSFEEHKIPEKKVEWLLEIDEDLLKKIYEGSYVDETL